MTAVSTSPLLWSTEVRFVLLASWSGLFWSSKITFREGGQNVRTLGTISLSHNPFVFGGKTTTESLKVYKQLAWPLLARIPA